jgi:hypothetical protein
VADTNLPLQANYSTLNSNFGSNSWVYLGLIRYGDQASTANAIVAFTQTGHYTSFLNSCVGNVTNCPGIRLSTQTGATSNAWSYASGTSGAVLPNNITQVALIGAIAAGSSIFRIEGNSSGGGNYRILTAAQNSTQLQVFPTMPVSPTNGFQTAVISGSVAQDLFVNAFIDGSLGVGSNPLL